MNWDKVKENVGGFLDVITTVMLFAYASHLTISQRYIEAALLFIALGVWAISIQLCAMTKIFTKTIEFLTEEKNKP